MTARLRVQVAAAVTTTNRAVSEVGDEHGLAWWTVHCILVAAARTLPEQAAPTTAIGIDETHARSVRWLREQATDEATDQATDQATREQAAGEVSRPRRWVRSNPWMTSIVDLDPACPGGIIGLAPGRSGQCFSDWIALQSNEFRAGVKVVAIDPSGPVCGGGPPVPAGARIVVDDFHLVLLANTMVTDVRQRVQREQHARRGRKVDAAWAHRRLLLRAGDKLSPAALARLSAVLDGDDPTQEIGAAWAIRELLCQLLAGNGPGLVLPGHGL